MPDTIGSYVWDEKTGYYYDQSSGLYYDPKTKVITRDIQRCILSKSFCKDSFDNIYIIEIFINYIVIKRDSSNLNGVGEQPNFFQF